MSLHSSLKADIDCLKKTKKTKKKHYSK